ncbi:MAG: hypothetical protein EBU90_19210 [Proteobacteria bacterium]|nr:hypothetical protein [Pseudomonadota bacterium]NBP14462.1 hypothetical protein [bacterium]
MKKKSHGPVVYIDPRTGLPKCSPDQCKDKLVEHIEVIETNYKWVGGPVKHYFHYSICDECNTRTITNENKNKTDSSYKRAIKVGNGVDPNIIKEIEDGRTQES